MTAICSENYAFMLPSYDPGHTLVLAQISLARLTARLSPGYRASGLSETRTAEPQRQSHRSNGTQNVSRLRLDRRRASNVSPK